TVRALLTPRVWWQLASQVSAACPRSPSSSPSRSPHPRRRRQWPRPGGLRAADGGPLPTWREVQLEIFRAVLPVLEPAVLDWLSHRLVVHRHRQRAPHVPDLAAVGVELLVEHAAP